MTIDLHTKLLAAAAALAALLLASCAKVETSATGEPVRVSFSVAGAPEQTRTAVTGGSLLDEGCTSFYCNAWYNPVVGAAQRFMDTAEILPDQTPNPTVWAPERSYFWPTTGTVNFFSYASARPLGNALSITNDGKTFTITDYTVTSHDNIMIADAVYNATYANAGSSTDVTDSGNTNAPLTGVPTIFRHLLAQVQMDLQLYAASPTNNTTYEVEVTNVTLKNFRDRGSLTITNTYAGSGFGIQEWSPASDGTELGWVAASVSAHDVDLTPDDGRVIILEAGDDEGDHVIFLGGGSVMPQTLENTLAISITITIRTKHGDITYNEDKGIVLQSDLSPGVGTSWKMNQRIIYHIKIDPVTTTLSFDPAISPWDPGNPPTSPTDGGTVQL